MHDIEFSDTLFKKYLAFPNFWSDLIGNLTADSKRIKVVRYEVSCGYAALIDNYDLLKVVPFFLDHQIHELKGYLHCIHIRTISKMLLLHIIHPLFTVVLVKTI